MNELATKSNSKIGGFRKRSHGSLPVNVGQPMLRVSEITVGGTKGE